MMTSSTTTKTIIAIAITTIKITTTTIRTTTTTKTTATTRRYSATASDLLSKKVKVKSSLVLINANEFKISFFFNNDGNYIFEKEVKAIFITKKNAILFGHKSTKNLSLIAKLLKICLLQQFP